MYQRRRENVRRKIWPKEERKDDAARTYNVKIRRKMGEKKNN
jgi:hypothetical protein